MDLSFEWKDMRARFELELGLSASQDLVIPTIPRRPAAHQNENGSRLVGCARPS